MHFFSCALGAAMAIAAAGTLHAQAAYPGKPVKIVVPVLTPYVFVVSAQSSVSSMGDLLALIRADGSKIT